MRIYRIFLCVMFMVISMISITSLGNVYSYEENVVNGDIIYSLDEEYIYRFYEDKLDFIKLNGYEYMEYENSIIFEKMDQVNLHIYGDILFLSGMKEDEHDRKLNVEIYNIFDKSNPIKINEFKFNGYNYLFKEKDGVIYLCVQKNESDIRILSFDLDEGDILPNIYEFEGEEENFIYLCNDDLYVICNEGMFEKNFTTIYKFQVFRGEIVYINKISFDGRILNEKFIDEYNGNLRVLGYCENRKNKIYIFDKDLKNVNCIDIILENENISNIYFDGETCYISGFLNDGYFSIYNLNYNNPTEIGRIKLSSSLNYIYKLSDDKIIIVGNEHRSDTYKNTKSDKVYEIIKNTGIKINLIDVSNKNKPKIFDEYFIKGKEVYSSAFINENNLIYSRDKNILAFPLDILNYSIDIDINSAMEVFSYNIYNDIISNYEKVFTGVYVFDVNDKEGIDLKCIIDSKKEFIDYKDIENIKIFNDNIFLFKRERIEVFDLEGCMLGEYTFRKKETI